MCCIQDRENKFFLLEIWFTDKEASESRIWRRKTEEIKAYRIRICKPFKEPRNRFPDRRAGTPTQIDVPARQAT
jgi:hypothetical protein